jgi:hypothetical protein
MTRQRAVPLVVLAVAVVAIARFSQGFRVVDTVGLLVSGVVAGASIAALSGLRRSP